ncbi:MAG TPA: DUF1269 domain-containing protein [Ktedonobacterales bacterium]|jgi:uncharacterized membrane protein
MSDVPIQVIVAAFQQEDEAEEALKRLKEAKKEQVIGIENAAVLHRDEEGKLHIKEAKDMRGGKGAAIGGVVGAVAGLLAGPLVLAAGAGALIGGLAARLHDSGFSDERLKQLGQALTPGSSALVAVIEHTWVKDVEEMLADYGANVVTESIKADIAEQLEAGHGVAYTAVGADEASIAGRTTFDDKQEATDKEARPIPPEQVDTSEQGEVHPGQI